MGIGFGDETVAPTCPAPADFVTQSGDCNDQDPNINPDALDVPDAEYGDQNCDGTDSTAADMVFVDSLAPASMLENGTREYPFAGIEQAAEFAAENGLKYIALRFGGYLIASDLVDGISNRRV